ncbi:MAG TPA: hypothetical protein VF381_05885, partial [Thermoanaerobaculia bacterium]
GTDLALFDTARRRPAVAEYLNAPTGHEVFCAADQRYHLILGLDDRQELYDYASDPAESHSLPLAAEHTNDLRERINAARHQWDGMRSTASVFRSLGYLE